MGFKWFGKLAGNTSAAAPAVLRSTSPANTTTPYTAALPGTKFRAVGEHESSSNSNRALAALQENLEALAAVLDGPALADTRIVAATSTDQGYGAPGLASAPISTAMSTLIDLSEATSALANPGNAPITYVYVGLHKSRLTDFVRVYRYASDGAPGEVSYESENPYGSNLLNCAVPSDVYNAGVSYFPTASLVTGLGDESPHALTTRIPPITPVQTTLPPYLGNPVTVTLTGGDVDGVYASSGMWQSYYVRAGCYLHIAGSTDEANDGLFRVARTTRNGSVLGPSADKAVLTRGGLTKVTLGDATDFPAGDLVSWRDYPNAAAPNTTLNTNYAYVVFRHGNYVYLGELGGEDDFTVDVTNGPGNKVHGGSGSSYGGAHAIGDTGVIDFEVDADSMATLQVGTVLHNLASGAESAVTAIVPAAYPVVFATGLANPGTATPCLPPGFLLNPQMYFDAGHLTGGNYVVHCKTLTTVREKLQNIGATGRWKIVPNTEDRLSPAVFEMGQIKAFARAVKTGQEAYATRSGGATTHEYPSGPFTGTAQILGENLWQVTLGPTGASSAETLLVSTHGAYPAYVGQVVTFSPWALGKIVACTGNVMVLCDVSSAGRVIDDLLANGNDPLIAGTSSVSGGDAAIPGFTVDSIAHAPYLAHGGAGNKLLPSPSGLDAQYNNHYHAVATSRGGGLGAVINMANSVPLTLLTKVYSSNDPILRMYTQAETAQKLVGWQTPTAGNTGGLTRLADGILGLYDKNASTPIPLSDAGHWSLPTGVESILKALAVYPWEHNTIADELRVYDGSTMSASTKLVFPNITASHAGGAGIEKKLIVDVDYNYYRQGWVTGTKWDLANCGAHSWAFGKDVKAADNYSQAFGAGATTESVGSSVFSGVVLSDSGGSVDYPGYAQEGKWHAVARTVANDEAQLLSSGSSRFVLADESTYFIEGTIAGRSVATATKSVVMKFTIQVSTKLTEALESDRVRGTANCTTSLNAVGAGHIPGGQVVDLPQNDYGPSAAWAIGDETGAWSWDNAARLEFKWDLVSLPASPAYLDLWVRNATVAGPEVYVWSCVLHTSKIRWA